VSLRTKLLTLTSAAAVLVPLALAQSAPASAAVNPLDQKIKQKLSAAANPTAGVNSLTPAERARFTEQFQHMVATATVVKTETVPVSTAVAARSAVGVIAGRAGEPAMRANVIAPTRCFKHYAYLTWKDFSFITTGNTWMQLEWCSNGKTVTGSRITFADGAGQHGNTYYGIAGQGTVNVGWEVRSYTKFHFGYGPVNAYPCMQIRGGATGQQWTRRDCNLG